MRILGAFLRKIPAVPVTMPQPPPSRIRTVIGAVFGKYLLLTNTLSSGLLMVSGDYMSQQVEYRRGTITKRYNLARSGTFSS